jgi:predicted DNA-binding transcriptional regulator YafY
MFTEEELEALILGVRVVQGWGDSTLAQAAQQVQAKVEAVLPERLQSLFSTSALFTINFQRLVFRTLVDAFWVVRKKE